MGVRRAALFFAACLAAQAGTLAIVPHGSGTIYGGGDRTWGWWFFTNESILVTHLGAWNPLSNLNTAHDVAIWTAADVLVASVQVPAGAGGSPDGFRWVQMSSPLVLPKGNVYKIGMHNTADSGDPIGWSNLSSGITVDQAIELTSLGMSSFALTAPNGTPQPGPSGPWGWFGPNFQFAVIPTPEPSSMALAALALAGVTLALRRRRSA